jgi:isoleucyl-tRNA synthetase
VVTRLLAPFIPFITEEVWRGVVRPGDAALPESVHLATWPVADPALIDPALSEQVALARTVTEAGRAARKASAVRVRQPLSRALVGLPAGSELSPALLDDIAAELNIKRLEPMSAADEAVDVTVKPNFRVLGKRFGKRTQQAANAVLQADPREIVAQLRSGGAATAVLDGEPISLDASEVIVTEVPRTGWVVESQQGVSVALNTGITPELAAEGIARDVVRVVQQARRDSGFEVSDRVEVTVAAPDEVVAALRVHEEFVMGETLADSLVVTTGDDLAVEVRKARG